MNVLHESTYLACFMKVICAGLAFTTTSLNQTEAFWAEVDPRIFCGGPLEKIGKQAGAELGQAQSQLALIDKSSDLMTF